MRHSCEIVRARGDCRFSLTGTDWDVVPISPLITRKLDTRGLPFELIFTKGISTQKVKEPRVTILISLLFSKSATTKVMQKFRSGTCSMELGNTEP